MKKLIVLIALLLFAQASHAQTNSQRVLFGTGAPSGTCPRGKLYIRTSNGFIYGCANGVWILAGAGAATPGGSTTQLQRNNAGAFGGISGATSDGTTVTYGAGNLRATSPQISTSIDDANGNELLKFTATASAVNEITVANAATGNPPTISATGNNTDIGITLTTKGAGGIIANSRTGSFRVGDTGGIGNSTKMILIDSTLSLVLTSTNAAINVFGNANPGSASAALETVGMASVGDNDGNGNNTVVQVSDPAQTITLNGATLLFSGNVTVNKTITAGGTTGARTIDKTAGSVNFAAVASSLVVTNALVTASSIILCTVATNDATLKSVQCVPGSGSFTMFANAAATAETKVTFLVTN